MSVHLEKAMRVIIEVDSKEELQETLALLGDRPVTVLEAPTASRRAALLREAIETYRIELPKDWKFDREEANER